jgi:hypothetical protein
MVLTISQTLIISLENKKDEHPYYAYVELVNILKKKKFHKVNYIYKKLDNY